SPRPGCSAPAGSAMAASASSKSPARHPELLTQTSSFRDLKFASARARGPGSTDPAGCDPSLDFGPTPERMAEAEADLEDEFAFGAHSDSSAIASTTSAKAAERREGSAFPD